MSENEAERSTSRNSSVPASPWLDYFSGRKVPADRFIRSIQPKATSGRKKPATKETSKSQNAVGIGETVVDSIVSVIEDKPDRGVQRLLDLLQASKYQNARVYRDAIAITDAAVAEIESFEFPRDCAESDFHNAVLMWSEGRGRPLKSTDVLLLLLLAHLGTHRQLWSEEQAWTVLADCTSVSEPFAEDTIQLAEPTPSLLGILLSAQVPESLLPTLAEHSIESADSRDRLVADAQYQANRAKNLAVTNEGLRTRIATLLEEVAMLETKMDQAAASRYQLEQQAVESRASHLHRLDDIRGHMKGALEGQLSRWLETSLEAIRSEPPRTEYVEERLEESLKLVQREIEWLRPSD